MRGFQILLFLAALHLAGGAFAAETPSQDKGRADVRLTISGDLIVGAQLVATFEMGGYEVPEGMYASINVDVMKRPEGERPDIQTGYPRTRLVFNTPGTYELRFRLNQISKSSCGGVDAVLLLETTQVLEIAPAERAR
ncbi:hypothetical protein SAMN04488082_10513 [Desulfomicrobium apsheronum]|uniref:YtkA-like n=1 Tax=Desulfomicrobium apsheronum TaxID=52560 RepID=A0A1I3T1K4_9BACT|nr:hypothetical protein [Desulfomicrobium apsheronum]SFJ63721.1 hypothetical protein SAMN04488082_10513 [Desulfomicrobium apsheronum]